MIDATTFDEIIDIITNPNTYGKCFAQVFNEVYPIGREQLRCSLGRLGSIRNHLAHGRACTSRQMEQAICYSNDLVDCIKRYFGSINMSKVYNVPTIIRFCDNMGNEHNLDGISENISSRIIDWRILGRGDLIPGEQLVAEVEIDPSFDAGDYHVKWYALSGKVWGDYMGTTALINIGIEHVGEQFELRFSVTTNRGWHRFSNCDDSLCLIYRVLPPP